MDACHHFALLCMLAAAPFCCNAADAAPPCDRDAVDSHVREQIQVYGPLSSKREYFGFIYLYEGQVASAVARGSICGSTPACGVQTRNAAQQIPPGARVLGEWHTHPHQGSALLSKEDVRGAYNNRHIRCYFAYYAKPNGEIVAWDPQQLSVPIAMASRALVGNYARQAQPQLHASAGIEVGRSLPIDEICSE